MSIDTLYRASYSPPPPRSASPPVMSPRQRSPAAAADRTNGINRQATYRPFISLELVPTTGGEHEIDTVRKHVLRGTIDGLRRLLEAWESPSTVARQLLARMHERAADGSDVHRLQELGEAVFMPERTDDELALRKTRRAFHEELGRVGILYEHGFRYESRIEHGQNHRSVIAAELGLYQALHRAVDAEPEIHQRNLAPAQLVLYTDLFRPEATLGVDRALRIVERTRPAALRAAVDIRQRAFEQYHALLEIRSFLASPRFRQRDALHGVTIRLPFAEIQRYREDAAAERRRQAQFPWPHA